MTHKYYYTYQIKVVNPQSSLHGACYFGKHETDDLDDGYFGSSKILSNYKKKYGIIGLEKTILHYYDSRKALCDAEHELIEEKRKDPAIHCLNLHEGGNGGRWKDYISEEEFEERVRKSTEGLLKKTTPEQRSRNARLAGKARRTPERRKAQSERSIKMHANRSAKLKAEIYAKAGNSRKAFNKTEYGKNSFAMSPTQWIKRTNAIGIYSKGGKYSVGTYAHPDIAFRKEWCCHICCDGHFCHAPDDHHSAICFL